MHYCPQCRYEYQQSVKTCPDCGSRIIDGEMPDLGVETEEQKRVNEEDAVALFESADYIKVRFLQDLLEQEGIAFFAKKYGRVEPSELYTGAQTSSPAVGDFTGIFVAPGDLPRAKELLQELENSKPVDEDDAPSEEEK